MESFKQFKQIATTATRPSREKETAMFNGTVNYRARVKGTAFVCEPFEFDPLELGVGKVTVEGKMATDGNERHSIALTVHLASVPCIEEGRALAERVAASTLDRIAYHHGIAIEDARYGGDQFIPLSGPQAGTHICSAFVGFCASAAVGISRSPSILKPQLEQTNPPGERYFGMFRDALRVSSPVEMFLHLYHLLVMLHDDEQAEVDRFIKRQNPAVPETQHPKKKPGVMETVYSRLRNEFAHPERCINIATIKAGMAKHVGELRELTRKAIELNP